VVAMTCGGLFPPQTKHRRDIVRRLFVWAMIGPSTRLQSS
jgi:hypothetical protein